MALTLAPPARFHPGRWRSGTRRRRRAPGRPRAGVLAEGALTRPNAGRSPGRPGARGRWRSPGRGTPGRRSGRIPDQAGVEGGGHSQAAGHIEIRPRAGVVFGVGLREVARIGLTLTGMPGTMLGERLRLLFHPPRLRAGDQVTRTWRVVFTEEPDLVVGQPGFRTAWWLL